MAAMTAPLTATAAGLVPSGSTARRDRTTRSYLIRLPPAEARRAVRRVRRLELAADPAGVSLRRELAEQRLEVQLACPGRAAGRDGGDLDVRDVTPGEVQRGELHPGVRERAVDVEPQPRCAHSGQSLMAFPAPRRCSVRATRQSVVYRRKLRLHFRITDEFGACSSSQRRELCQLAFGRG